VFSATTLEVVRRVDLASRPAGVSVSADGSEIFVGLAGAGAIAILDADTFAESRIFVGAELGTSETYQVVETAPGILYVSTGLDLADGRVARVDRGTGVITPISTTGFAEIELLADPAHRALFVGDGLQAQAPTVRKVDARNAASPLLLSSTQEPIDPTYRMSLDPAGARLYLAGGLVLATRDFSPERRITSLVSML